MKRLLVHIGYPKTATTTLQKALFIELHNMGLINYLGMGKDRQGNDIIVDYIYNNRNIYFDNMLAADILNIISREGITGPQIFKEKKYTGSIDLKVFPKKIAGLFDNIVDDLKILVSIRNQQSFIYSGYASEYKNLLYDNECNTFDKFLNVVFNNPAYMYAYCYSDLLNDYSRYFGKDSVNVLLFEDLSNDKDFYISELSRILSIEKDIIDENLKDKHLNKRIRYGDSTIVSAKQKTIDKVFFKPLYNNHMINKAYRLLKQTYGEDRVTVLKDKIKTGSIKKHKIPLPSDKENKRIYEKFKENNYKIAKDFNIDITKLKEYGYV